MNNWNRIWKPIVVLSLICVVVTGALAATNEVTAPIIEEATIAAENAARAEVLPEADSFSPVEGIAVEGVSAVYTADNGAGAAITASAKGYGGERGGHGGHQRRGQHRGHHRHPAGRDQGHRLQRGGQPRVSGQVQRPVRRSSLWCSTRTWTPVTSATVSSTAVINAVNAAIDAYNQIP